MDIHGRRHPGGNDWLKTSISSNWPSAIVVPMNPDAGVAKTLPAYAVMPTAAAPMTSTHVSFRRISPPSLIDSDMKSHAHDRRPGIGRSSCSSQRGCGPSICRRMPSIAAPPRRRYNRACAEGTTFVELAAVHRSNRRSAGFMEGNRRIPEARRHNRPALGKTGGNARSSPSSRQDGVGLCAPGRARRVDAQPQPCGLRSCGLRAARPRRAARRRPRR